MGSVGEPINEEAWNWYHENIGKQRCPIVDTWWQTETGGIMISPLAGITKLKPTYATLPLPEFSLAWWMQKEISLKEMIQLQFVYRVSLASCYTTGRS